MAVGGVAPGLPTPRVLLSETIDEEEEKENVEEKEEDLPAGEDVKEKEDTEEDTEETDLPAGEAAHSDRDGMRRRAGKASGAAASGAERT
jgi:hypothetical protein